MEPAHILDCNRWSVFSLFVFLSDITNNNNKQYIHSSFCSVNSVGAGGRWSLRRSGRGDGVGLR